MKNPALSQLVRYADLLLGTAAFGDYGGAVNGLQVENSGSITRIAAAVDASLSTVNLAVAAQANLLLVHHGLFWSPRQPWTGHNYELLRTLLTNDIAVYSSHLPLDAHAKFGNNAQLAAALELPRGKPFFPSHGQPIGLRTTTALKREELTRRLTRTIGDAPLVIPAGPTICRRIGIVTGGAGGELKQAAAAGVDTFITGEGPHWTYALAEELRINVFYAGHYATETFGVKALANHLARKFRAPWIFLDHPTGL